MRLACVRERGGHHFHPWNREKRAKIARFCRSWPPERPLFPTASEKTFIRGQARAGAGKGRIRRIAIVALARKLLVALWGHQRAAASVEGAGRHVFPLGLAGTVAAGIVAYTWW